MPVQTARQWVLLYGPYCVSWCGAAANFCLMEVIAEPLRNVVAQHVVYGQINVYGVTTKSERHKRSYWTRTADGNGIGGRKAPVPYGS